MEWDSQRSSISSNINSITSQSTSNNNNNQRSDKVPTLQQILPSPSVSALSKLTDDDLSRKGIEDLVRIVRRVESDYKSLLGEHGNIVKDVNRRYQIFVLESRGLKEVNQKLQDDNQELRDLCCFLDDDRQRGRKLAREWQRFGRYTASVMRSEVAVYQEKLHELEERQCELVKENVELKELCLFLDQERGRITGDRDEGDGSSNGTVTGQEDTVISLDANGSHSQAATHNLSGTHFSGSTNYIRDLEQKVQKLEEEKIHLSQRIKRHSAEGLDESTRERVSSVPDPSIKSKIDKQMHGSDDSKSPNPRKPEAVVHAMKVLHIHEELEKIPTEDENLDDTEKAIVREMCNVVWRKLGDVGDVGSFNDSSDSILDPPVILSSDTVQLANPTNHGQSQSFTISQPQPQLASTSLSPDLKTVHSHHVPDNKFYHQESRQIKNQPPIRPSPTSNQPPYHSMLPHQMKVPHSGTNTFIDTHEMRTNKPDKYSKEEQDKSMRTYPFSMPQPFPRPSSQPKKGEFKSLPSQQPPFQPIPHLPPSSEENLPPHFQSHRHRQMKQQQPQPQVPQLHQYSQNPSNVPLKSHSPAMIDKANAHGHKTDSSSISTSAIAPYHSNPPYQHSQSLTNSQHYLHHPVRLLDAPGSQPHHGLESRSPREENMQILNKPTRLHQESNLSRKDAAMSEPNVANPGVYRGARDLMNENRETSVSQMALRPTGAEQARKGPQVIKSLPVQGQSRDSSASHLSVSSRQQTQSQSYDKSGNASQASHPVKGGFRAYPRSGPPMSIQSPVSPHTGTNYNPNLRMEYSQEGDGSSRAPGVRPDSSKVYQQQEWRQTYLDDSDTL